MSNNLARIKDTGITLQLNTKPYVVVEMKNKNAMMIAKESYKIRELEETYRRKKVVDIVEKLSNQLGISDKGSVEHHIELIRFISNEETLFTENEIMLAFKLYQQGEFKDHNGNTMTAYSKLDVAIYCKVMLSYDQKQKAELDKYRKAKRLQLNPKTEPTPGEKRKLNVDAIYREFEYFQQKGFIEHEENGVEKTFDLLFSEGILKNSKEHSSYYAKKYTQAIKEIKEENSALNKNKLKVKSTWKELTNEISKKDSEVVKTKAKKIVVREFYQKLVKEKKHIKELLK